ncbi:MAG: NAD(P)H-binding protein [Candidatus Nanohaloarchaeota archaeon QJJ-7]|nr:NAD(P)H-binding protein [Candidatus Nanohaloarchaeota archaeon QJJ-7]
MEVAVIGGRGFVGREVTRKLREEHDVTTLDPKVGGKHHISTDITVSGSIKKALGKRDFDTVVNLAGLTPMKEPRGVSYGEVHSEGVKNVIDGCEAKGIERLVQMSALGADPEAEMDYLRTKGEGKKKVLDSDLEVTVIEPSIIFDDGNELVHQARMLASTRVFPHLKTRIQPVYRGDVAELFRLSVEGEVGEEVVEAGGPDEMSLFEFVKKIYRSEGYRCHPLPFQTVMSLGLQITEFLPLVPYGVDQARFLKFDNTTEENDAEEYVVLRSVDRWLSEEF